MRFADPFVKRDRDPGERAEGEAHGESAARDREQRRHDRAEGEEKEGERDRKRPALRAVGVVGARAPEVVVEGGLARPAQRRLRVEGAQFVRQMAEVSLLILTY